MRKTIQGKFLSFIFMQLERSTSRIIMVIFNTPEQSDKFGCPAFKEIGLPAVECKRVRISAHP